MQSVHPTDLLSLSWNLLILQKVYYVYHVILQKFTKFIMQSVHPTKVYLVYHAIFSSYNSLLSLSCNLFILWEVYLAYHEICSSYRNFT